MITRLFAMIWVVIVSAGVLKGQTSAERSALNNLEKQRWDKVNSNLNKAIRKDSLSVTAHYIKSQYFFTPENPAYQIDSAYAFCMEALALFPAVDVREREKLNRIPLDSAVLVNLRIRIDSAAFGRAMHINTEEGYGNFLKSFPYAAQRERAEELRHEVAYLDALKENTYQSYYSFLTKYPDAERATEARRRYEKLLFTTLTADKKLATYKAFVRDYPNSPYRQDALDEIFEISTASGDPISFLNFLAENMDSRKAKVAREILFHLSGNTTDDMVLTDSLQAVQILSQGYLVPFLRDNQFGLMNSEGVDVLKNIGSELDHSYLCGNILEDIFITKDGVVARNGAMVYEGEVEEIEELGSGFLLITNASCRQLIHASGRVLSTDCLIDARVLAGRLLAIKMENRWALISFGGRLLTEYDFQDVKQIGEAIALQKGEHWFLKHPTSIGALADGMPLQWDTYFDAVEPWPANKIWTKKNGEESILDEDFQALIPPTNQKLTATFFGALGETVDSKILYNAALKNVGTFKNTKVYDPWVGVQIETKWRLFDVSSKKILGAPFDSINFTGPVAVGYRRDSMQVFFNKEVNQSFLRMGIIFIPGKDSISFVCLQKGDEQQLYNSHGEKLFHAEYDQIHYLGEGFFMVEKKKKKGLVQRDGKVVLPLEYDGIGGIIDAKTIPLLKTMKFGAFTIVSKKLIKPVYDKNVTPYGSDFLVAYKDGAYGFINWENKPQSKFEFEEVRYWNDSVAWVKKDYQWMLYALETKSVKRGMIKDYRLIKDTPEEKIAIIHEDTAYGVISNKKGTIIPATFSDIVNIGSAEKPFYMTEKYVEEASLFVVIYYNHEGKFLRRQAYEAEDYERIYCSN